MKIKILAMITVLLFLLQIITVSACGGRNLIFSENPQEQAYEQEFHEGYGKYVNYDSKGNLILRKDDIKITKGIADEVIKEFLDENYPNWENFAFEVLDLEHGRPVYMYEAHVPNIALTYHVGVAKFVTDHIHLHVDAFTGELLDVGCGGGPSKVLTKYEELGLSTPDDWNYVMPKGKSYFYTKFVIPEGKVPKIDGKIEEKEWEDSIKENIHFGSVESEILSYGCGGSGKIISNYAPAEQEVEVYSKIVGENIYFAVRSESPNWIGLMFKDFPHHGMIGDFGDVKILTTNGISDHYLSSNPLNIPVNKESGKRGCSGGGNIVKDSQNNIIEAGSTSNGHHEYEFSFPLDNEDNADTHWKKGGDYQIAVLLGNSEQFYGITKDTWMSGQETVKLVSQLDYKFITENPNHDHDSHDHHDHKHEENREEGSTGFFYRIKFLLGLI